MSKKITLLFGAAVFLQLVLLLVIPIPRFLALNWGRTVVLETAPVDPYSVLQGYYARLSYRISPAENLPFAKSSIEPANGRYYFVVLSPGANGVWEPQRVYARMPGKLKKNEVALKGIYRYDWMEYGIEQYYLPENTRRELGDLLGSRGQKILVTVKVGRDGQGAIEKIQVGEKRFEY